MYWTASALLPPSVNVFFGLIAVGIFGLAMGRKSLPFWMFRQRWPRRPLLSTRREQVPLGEAPVAVRGRGRREIEESGAESLAEAGEHPGVCVVHSAWSSSASPRLGGGSRLDSVNGGRVLGSKGGSTWIAIRSRTLSESS